MLKKRFILILCALLHTACTTYGELAYITPEGEHKTGCQTAYSGAPEVDRHAVNYYLVYCAKKAAAAGHTVINQALLNQTLDVPAPPKGQTWTFELATAHYRADKLTAKEYGHLVAAIDLALQKSQ